MKYFFRKVRCIWGENRDKICGIFFLLIIDFMIIWLRIIKNIGFIKGLVMIKVLVFLLSLVLDKEKFVYFKFIGKKKKSIIF